MMKSRAVSIAKFELNAVNEDAVLCRDNLIAVSDGAGGGGVFADCWSRHLVNNLPDKALSNYESLDDWIDNIWETFYDEYETKAKNIGGMFLNKFYDEGSYATLAAAWKISNNKVRWITYGDSVVFHYNRANGKLEYSIEGLSEFNNAPPLITYIDKIDEKKVKTGIFEIDINSLVFISTDALSHYILMMYMLSQKKQYDKEINDAINCCTKNSNYIKVAMTLNEINFYTDVIKRLFLNDYMMKRHLNRIYKEGLIALDDYSIAIAENEIEI